MSVDDLIKKAREAAKTEPNVGKLRMTILELCNEVSNQQVVNMKLEAAIHRFVKESEDASQLT